ncbi:MAG: hypothetical protein KQH63_00185 [Desulfobulbaceae bacterium]|nr:hypothetical protein [Desulfobulbaceae bacterium]
MCGFSERVDVKQLREFMEYFHQAMGLADAVARSWVKCLVAAPGKVAFFSEKQSWTPGLIATTFSRYWKAQQSGKHYD